MDPLSRIRENFSQSAQLKLDSVDRMAPSIARGGETLEQVLEAGGKILSCGNGGSAADAQHFAAELINRFQVERPALAAIALTTDSSTLTSIANDYAFDDIFARQVAALGQPGDALLAITTSGNSSNVIRAIEAAHAREMIVVLLNGGDAGRAPGVLMQNDVEIRVPTANTARTQEVHILVIHCLCEILEQKYCREEDA